MGGYRFVGCPTHGSAAELVLRFRSTQVHGELRCQPSTHGAIMPVQDKPGMPNIVPVWPLDTLYAMRIEVMGGFDVQEKHYKVADI